MIKKRRMIVIAIVFILLAGAAFGGFRYWKYKAAQEEEAIRRIDKIRDIQYGENFGMRSDDIFMYHGASVEENGIDEDENKDKEIVFVLERPAEGDDSCITIYPTEKTEWCLENFNEAIEWGWDDIDISQYGVSYPISLEDIVFRRQEIRELLDDLHGATQSYIFSGRSEGE